MFTMIPASVKPAAVASGNTKALLHFDNSLADSAGIAVWSGTIAYDTTHFLAGGASGLFSGTPIKTQQSTAFGIGAGAFTAEGFCYSSDASAYRCIFDTREFGAGYGLYLHAGGNGLTLTDNGSILVGSPALGTGVWIAWAIARDASGVVRGYINGVLVFTYTDVRTLVANSSIWLGCDTGGTQPFLGSYEDFRFTNGVARYTGSSYTVPSAPLSLV